MKHASSSDLVVILADVSAAAAGGLSALLERGKGVCCRVWRPEQSVAPAKTAEACAAITGSLEGVRRIRQSLPSVPVFLFTDQGSETLAIDAFRAGVEDYYHHASEVEDLIAAVRRRAETCAAGQRRPLSPTENQIVGHSAQILSIRDYVHKIADTDSNVLITGETGTGKELIAKLIHESSRRAKHPMLSVNCAAIPESLLESELFGYERGAFTGAHCSMPGKLELAQGGTIFFDEIADLSPYSQAKLLRVTEGREFQRLGGRKSVTVDVRILAATNHDLDSLAMEDRFRKDLYFRLNVGRVHLPALRERRSDIPELMDYYLEQFQRSFGGKPRELSPETRRLLLEYSWPGNIRELRNVLESVFVAQPAQRITFHDLPEWFQRRLGTPVMTAETECERIVSALNATQWNKSKAAHHLEWSRMTLYRKMAKYHLKSA